MQQFEIDEDRFKVDTKDAIKKMESYKAIGTDGVHVEMLKANPTETADLITKMWKFIGKRTCTPKDWLKGKMVPLFKCKGEQNVPSNSRPLCILSHLRKIVEKAVVTYLKGKLWQTRHNTDSNLESR